MVTKEIVNIDKINLYAVCENSIFITFLESKLNKNNIFVAGICSQPNHAIRLYQKCIPIPDIVLLDADWPNTDSKALLKQFLNLDARVILVTDFSTPEILDDFSPLQPQGYFYQSSENYEEIIECIKLVSKNKGCWIF